MSVSVPESGTRGSTMSRLRGPLIGFTTELMFRIFRNRRLMGFPVLMLTTIGARTGQPRRTVLGWFRDAIDADALIIVASAGGAAKHPAWFFNLAKHPDQVWIEVGDRKLKVRPEVLSGAERDDAWQRVITEAPNYAAYPTKTHRVIPLIRLVPA